MPSHGWLVLDPTVPVNAISLTFRSSASAKRMSWPFTKQGRKDGKTNGKL